MNDLLKKLEGRQNLAYAYIRIFLGLALAVRGLMLIAKPESISQLVSDENMYMGYAYVAIIHLLGGLLLIIGFFTRLAAFFQIPVLMGAVFFVHAGEGLMTAGQSLELAVMVLFLLAVFTIFGSGPLSLHERLMNKS